MSHKQGLAADVRVLSPGCFICCVCVQAPALGLPQTDEPIMNKESCTVGAAADFHVSNVRGDMLSLEGGAGYIIV